MPTLDQTYLFDYLWIWIAAAVAVIVASVVLRHFFEFEGINLMPSPPFVHFRFRRRQFTPLRGLIPSANVVKYIQRGGVEHKVRTSLLKHNVAAVVGVASPGGAGKTELAIRVAKELRRKFNAVYWITLTGRSIESALADLAWYCQIDLAPQLDLRGRADAVKNRLSQLRALVVLDDVHEAHVAKLDLLIPPAPCATLITSRIRDIKHVLPNSMFSLDRMTPDQSRELLASIITPEGVKSEREIADKLARRVQYNPLALDISARLIKRMADDNVRNPISIVYSRVKDRLKSLKIGEGERESVFACIGLSYDDLSSENQVRFYRLAAFHPTGFSISGAAALWGDSTDEARDQLEHFVNLSLIRHIGADRFRFYDLVDEYARDKLSTSDEEDAVRTAHCRYLGELLGDPQNENAAVELAGLERENLRLCADWAIKIHDGNLLAQLTCRLSSVLIAEAESWLNEAIRFGITNPTLKADTLLAVGNVRRTRCDLAGALASCWAAFLLYRSAQHRLGMAIALGSIGEVQHLQGDIESSLASNRWSLKHYKLCGSLIGEANALMAIGDALRFQANPENALMSYTTARTMFKSARDRRGEARANIRILAARCLLEDDRMIRQRISRARATRR